jgi:hypothetical protein
MTNETTTTALTPEIVKAQLTVALSKEGLAYQNLLQACENVTFTKDNLNEERTVLKDLRKVKSNLAGMTNPYTAAWKGWNEARKSLTDPVDALLTKKEKEFAIVSQEIAAENASIEAEKQRVKGIKDAIDTFFLEQSQAVANTSDPSEIVRIEKLIGSNKANKTRYAEFLPLLVEKADILAELIKDKKTALRELEALNEAENNATDDQTVLDILEKKEQVEAKIEQTKNDVQEKALKMATEAEIVEPEIMIAEAPKPRLSKWSYEIIDIKQAEKAGLTLTVIDEKKVKEILAKKREDETECTENGIRYFILRKY